MSVTFYSKIRSFSISKEEKIIKWLKEIADVEKKRIEKVKYIFVSKKEILSINREFLKHNYRTDIITFDYSFLNNIRAEIYICIEEVRSNAKEYCNGNFEKELLRVIVHGLLHVIGYNDIDKVQKEIMREKENEYLSYLE